MAVTLTIVRFFGICGQERLFTSPRKIDVNGKKIKSTKKSRTPRTPRAPYTSSFSSPFTGFLLLLSKSYSCSLFLDLKSVFGIDNANSETVLEMCLLSVERLISSTALDD